jgi:hypothetical protein
MMDEQSFFGKVQQVGLEMEASGNTAEGRTNVYACTPPLVDNPNVKGGCGYWIVTIDRAAGTTPMFTRCGHCGGTASSRMYKVAEGLIPTHEWFRPKNEAELKPNYEMNDALANHLLNGGLLLRPVKGKKDRWIKPSPEIKAFITAEQKRVKEMMGTAMPSAITS